MSLDWEIYRQLIDQSEHPLWGMFPHPPLTQIARRLDVATNTVWRKLRDWRESGFLTGYVILPHPELLRVGLSGYTISVADPQATVNLLTSLESINGVLLATHDVGSKVRVIAVAEDGAAQERRKESIRNLSGVVSIGPTRAAWLPPLTGGLTVDDWSLIVAMRKAPDDSIAELAGRVGVSPKTVTRHLARLRRSHAVLSLILEDWSRFPEIISLFMLKLRPGTNLPAVCQRFQRSVPSSVLLARLDAAPNAPGRELSFLAPVNTVAVLDDHVREGVKIPGVVSVETAFRVRDCSYPDWIDERIDLLRPRKPPENR